MAKSERKEENRFYLVYQSLIERAAQGDERWQEMSAKKKTFLRGLQSLIERAAQVISRGSKK